MANIVVWVYLVLLRQQLFEQVVLRVVSVVRVVRGGRAAAPRDHALRAAVLLDQGEDAVVFIHCQPFICSLPSHI